MNSPITKKITLIIVLISLGSILISGFFINYSLNRQFQHYLFKMDQAREKQVVNILIQIYLENNGWPDRPTVLGMGQGNFLDRLHYVTNTTGEIVLYTRSGMMRPHQTPEDLTPRPIESNGRNIGTAYFGKSPIQDVLTRQNNLFRVTINRSILIAILFTGCISFLVAIIFARKISTPIRAMNQTAKDMTTGNLETRVRDLPQDELGELGESLNKLADRLKHVEILRKKMTADVAHDLRTPLATVRSHLEGMIDQVIPASAANLDSLLDEVKRLGNLVQSLQEIALADRAIQHFNIEPIPLEQFLTDLVRKKTPLFAEKGLELTFSYAEAVSLKADRDTLSKIFDNLLSNAYKYTPAGKTVAIRLTGTSESIQIGVTDEGIGIAPSDLPFIFERFYRTDQSRNRESGGFGLGLTIVKELTEALGGTVTAQSELGKGSTFTIQFPVKSS